MLSAKRMPCVQLQWEMCGSLSRPLTKPLMALPTTSDVEEIEKSAYAHKYSARMFSTKYCVHSARVLAVGLSAAEQAQRRPRAIVWRAGQRERARHLPHYVPSGRRCNRSRMQ